MHVNYSERRHEEKRNEVSQCSVTDVLFKFICNVNSSNAFKKYISNQGCKVVAFFWFVCLFVCISSYQVADCFEETVGEH